MPRIYRDGELIELTPTQVIDISHGDSQKSFLSDGTHRYIVKKPRNRTFGGIFKESLPAELIDYSHWTSTDFKLKADSIASGDQQLLAPFAQHLADLLFEAALGEVLYQLVAKALFSSFQATESYVHIEPETNEPCIISKFCPNFNEFLEKKLLIANKKRMVCAEDWNLANTPTRADLNLNDNENYLLGKIYALGLLTNDWDLFNNIMLSNSGCMGDSATATKIMVVDGGNKFHFGFNGLTCDETCFENSEFNPNALKTHPLKGYLYTMPFDGLVCLKLPRLLIPDLFLLDNQHLFSGFKEVLHEAETALMTNPLCITQAVHQLNQYITLDSCKTAVNRLNNPNNTLINRSYYYSSPDSNYNLARLLKERCHTLQIICKRIEEGESMEAIHQDHFRSYKVAQESPLTAQRCRFFIAEKNEDMPCDPTLEKSHVLIS